jgi:hypothetical protein
MVSKFQRTHLFERATNLTKLKSLQLRPDPPPIIGLGTDEPIWPERERCRQVVALSPVIAADTPAKRDLEFRIRNDEQSAKDVDVVSHGHSPLKA